LYSEKAAKANMEPLPTLTEVTDKEENQAEAKSTPDKSDPFAALESLMAKLK